MNNLLIHGDNLNYLKCMPDESVDLIYIDPPFNTGKKQTLNRIKTTEKNDTHRTRKGFGNKIYGYEETSSMSYEDSFDDFIEFLRPRIVEARRVLKKTGSMYLHLDYREVHYIKVMCDEIFSRTNFLNEIIWSYDYGAKSKTKWPTKHDNILVYVKDIENYYFDWESIDRIPYMAPGLVGPEKAALGKKLTDTWFHTIVPTNGKERTGYPTQKPLGIINRIVKVSCPKNGIVLDFFAGSGTIGDSCILNDRKFILIDKNHESIEVIEKRLKDKVDYVKVII
jgi:site-specific DNA-methyltransferase (adenine-specific)